MWVFLSQWVALLMTANMWWHYLPKLLFISLFNSHFPVSCFFLTPPLLHVLVENLWVKWQGCSGCMCVSVTEPRLMKTDSTDTASENHAMLRMRPAVERMFCRARLLFQLVTNFANSIYFLQLYTVMNYTCHSIQDDICTVPVTCSVAVTGWQAAAETQLLYGVNVFKWILSA